MEKWINPTCSMLEVLVAHSIWRSHLKNLWRILCESFSLFQSMHHPWLLITKSVSRSGPNAFMVLTWTGILSLLLSNWFRLRSGIVRDRPASVR